MSYRFFSCLFAVVSNFEASANMALRTLGDVLTRSGPCVTVSEDATIRTLATALVKHRIDAVSVLSSSDGSLCGIATARDVSKCIARSLDLDTTNVSLVMTPNPVTLPPNETPANALSLMRQGQFRHIPVTTGDNMDGTGNTSRVIGVVDVLSLAYDAITRLQLSYSMIPSRRGYDLLRAARETIEKPTLRPIVERTPFTTLSRNRTVAQACELIVTKHVAAIVIVDANGVLDGIFTCTDVVKRVVVSRKDPSKVLLADVMTANPDCAGLDFTILESLQRMQACGFRHLPVVDDHSRVVVGLVDVLQLASDTLLDLNSAANKRSSSPSSEASLTARNSFHRSSGRVGLGRGLANFFGSLFSNSYAQRDDNSDVVSGAANNASVPSSAIPIPPLPTSRGTLSTAPTRQHYGYLPANNAGRMRQARADVPLASFKLKDVNGDFRRIKVPMVLERGDFDQFVLDIRRRYGAGSGAVKIRYVDEDGDDVLIANDDDLASCFEDVARVQGRTVALKVEEERVTPKLQSPVSSAPSSVIGSPGQHSVSSDRQDEGSLKPSVEPPPLEQPPPIPIDEKRPAGVYRTNSRLMIHTPSTRKASQGHQMMLDKRIDEAIVLFTEALELNPNNARARGERGAAHLLNGSSVDAEEDYRTSVQLLENGTGGRKGDMTYQMCIVGLVESLIDQRRYEEAVAVAQEMKPEWGNSGCADAFRDELDSASNAAQQALESGEFADAMTCYSNAVRVEMAYLKLVPTETGRVSLRLGRAKCYKALEDYDMALEDYEAAVALNPESVAGHKGRGKCLAQLEQLPMALEAFEQAHQLDPADEEVTQEIATLKRLLPDPLQTKKKKIAEIGALLEGLKLPGKNK